MQKQAKNLEQENPDKIKAAQEVYVGLKGQAQELGRRIT